MRSPHDNALVANGMSTTSVSLIQRPVNQLVASRLRVAGFEELLETLYASRGAGDGAEIQGTYRDLIPTHSLKTALPMANYLAGCAVTQTARPHHLRLRR